MTFQLGKPLLAMTFISMLGAAWYGTHRDSPRQDLTLWVFAGPQFHDYQDILRGPYESRFGKSLGIDLIPTRAMDMRLPVLFMSPGKSTEMPDAVEVEIQSIGRYLRPPVDEVGFLPLNHYLETSGYRQISSLQDRGQTGWNARLAADGKIYTFAQDHWRPNPTRKRPDAWIDRILPSRLAPATKDGLVFAIPHDVHPVTLAFRDDLFRAAGVPLIDDSGHSTVATWSALQEKCLAFQSYWQARGYGTRHAIELPESGAGALSVMLMQRHIALIDAHQQIHLNDPKVAQTLAFYVQLVAGPRRINGEAPPDSGLEYNDLAEGNLCSLLMPDWKVAFVRQYVPGIAGKLRMIPLPRFDDSDAPTATYGGTLVAIPRGSKHPDEAWKLIEYLYFSDAALSGREKVGILPALPEAWDSAIYHQPDPFFGGEKCLELYADLAPDVPPLHVSPVTAIALNTLSYVQSKAVGYMRANGQHGLEQQCQVWLALAAIDLQRRIDHAEFGIPAKRAEKTE